MSTSGEAAIGAANTSGRRQFDETLNVDGSPRPGWAFVLDRLHSIGPDGVAARRAEIERQLRANGIGFNVPKLDSAEPSQPAAGAHSRTEDTRPWSLDLVPMIIEAADWDVLQRGLIQRGRLLQGVLDDIYGEQHLLRDRLLPPALVYAHPGYLRDAVGVAACREMPLYGIDVSRSPSGDWYVADDLCAFPEGLGYTLENRLVSSRVLPQLFREGRVLRVASYFRAMQALVSDSVDRDARCVLLGRGASDPHRFEVAWLAKYLGYTLVELDDLSVRAGKVFLRTVAGLQRVDVILRFLPDHMLDSLTSDSTNGIGLPGLMHAVREGTVKVINPPGNSVVSNPALNAYLPALSQALLGEDLILPGAPTYWLGDADHRSSVTARGKELLFRDIRTRGALIDPDVLSDSEHQALQARIDLEPQRFVAQERIDRSVVPVWDEHGTHERQVTVRLHAVNTANDAAHERVPEVLTGGLALLDNDSGGRRQRFDDLDGSKDVWVLSPHPVRQDTLLRTTSSDADYALVQGEMPSRVAEHLFWFGRNAERAEFTARLLRGVITELQDEDLPQAEQTPSPSLAALLRATSVATGALPGFVGRGASKRLRRPDHELNLLFNDSFRMGSLPNALRQLDYNAQSLRDRISREQLLVLNELNAFMRVDTTGPVPQARDPQTLISRAALLDDMLGRLSALSGLMHENLTHGEGWNYMMLGRRIARAAFGSRALRAMTDGDLHDSRVLEAALALFDSVMTYRSRYRSRIESHLTVHLLALDESNPRSLAFQFQKVDEIVALLHGNSGAHRPSNALSRLAAAGVSRVRLAEASALVKSERNDRQSLNRFLGVLEQLPDELATELTARYFTHVESRQSFGPGSAGGRTES